MRRRHVAFAVLALLLAAAAGAVSPNIVISQVYGGGGNSGATYKNDFIELFNRGGAAVDVTGWTVQYASSSGSSWQKTVLAGTIQPGQYYLVQENAGSGGSVSLPTPDASGSISMSATAGKVALVSNGTTLSGTCPDASAGVVDFVGFGSAANCYEGAGATPTLSNTTAALRTDGGCADTDSNAADFSTGAPTPRNTASPFNVCGGPTDPSGTGAATPAAVMPGATALLTVTVTPGANPTSTGLAVTADLTAIGGSALQWFYDDGSHGDTAAGDNTFSFEATVDAAAGYGAKTLPATISDAQARTATATITLTVEPPPTPIHDIQGSGATSPLVGQLVATTGIVTGVRYNDGFFIQAPDLDADADPATSEGIFVYVGSAPPPEAAVGNLVKVVGTVKEYVPSADPYSASLTELVTPAITALATGQTLPDAVTLTAADTDPAGGLDQLERFEGMRVHADALLVVAPTDGSFNESAGTGTSNGVFYGVLPGIARPFLEPGVIVGDPLPAGAPPAVPRFDGNPERIRVNSYGLKGSTRLEVTSGATVTDVTGPLDFAYRSYTILPDVGSLTPASVTGNVTAAPLPDPCPAELTVATANLERFGDAIQSDAGLERRLAKISLAVRDVLKLPDVLGVEEATDLPSLQALAARIGADAVAAGLDDPNYQPYLEEGNDPSAIDVGFLVRAPKVEVVSVLQIGKDATYINPNTGLPAILNDRPPLVLHALIHPPAGPPFPVTVIVNHLKALDGVADPIDGRVRAKRAAQAEFLAELIQSYQALGESVLSVGDYNSTEFSDGYVDVIGTVLGDPAPAGEVVLATSSSVNPVLADLVYLAAPDQRYSYVYDGNAQTLDHILVTGGLLPRVNAFRYVRTNADFPESYRGDTTRPERYSDHDPAVVSVQLPTYVAGAAAAPAQLWPANHKMVPVTVSYDLANLCTVDPVSVQLVVTSNEPVNGLGDGDTAPDWVVVDAHHVLLRAERSGTGAGRTYTITITATDSRGNVETQPVTVTVPHDR